MKAQALAALLLASQVQAVDFPSDFSAIADRLKSSTFIKGVLEGTQANRDQIDSACITDFETYLEGVETVKAELNNPNYGKVAQTIASVAGQAASVFNDCRLDDAMMSFSKMTTSLSGLLDGSVNSIMNIVYDSDVDTSDFATFIACYTDAAADEEDCGQAFGGVMATFFNYEVPEATLTFDVTGTVFEKYVN